MSSSLVFVGQQITIYIGTLTLIAGVIGGLLNIVVFLSLHTFRQNPCAFYLTIMSIVNVGQMLTGLLSRILDTGFDIDWSEMSIFFCKFRFYCYQVCALTSMTCLCLSTIDQYLTTCSRPQWQQWSNIKVARRLSAIFVVIWIIHNIPFLIYFSHLTSSTTGSIACRNTNNIFQQYFIYSINLILGKFLPIFITFFFGFLAYRNVRQLAHRTVPLVRRELDKQLTIMVLLLVIFAFFTILPYSIAYLLSTIPGVNKDPIITAGLQFTNLFTTYLSYIFFASPFYIFLCASDRFRRQLIYVLFNIYLKQGRERRMAINQGNVSPSIINVDTDELASIASKNAANKGSSGIIVMIIILLSLAGACLVAAAIVIPVLFTYTTTTTTTSSSSVATTTLASTTTTIPTLRWNATGTTLAGVVSTTGSAANQLTTPFGLFVDSSYSVYIADYGNNRIQKWLTGASSGTTVAGQASGVGGSNSSQLSGPGGVYVDSSGNIYVADTLNSRIQFWASGASSGTTVAGTTGTSGSANNQLNYPYSVTRDSSSGTLYISDFNNHRVMRYLSGASSGTVVAGGYGPGTNSSQLYYPIAICFDSSSNSVVIANYMGNNIVRWVIGASSWIIVAGSASATSGSTSTLLASPVGMALDSLGNVYVADAQNYRIQFFLAGQTNGTTIAGVTGVTGTNSTLLGMPYGVAVDSQFNVYVADTFNARVVKFSRY